jgi:hypothetical protein
MLLFLAELADIDVTKALVCTDNVVIICLYCLRHGTRDKLGQQSMPAHCVVRWKLLHILRMLLEML